jgi:4-hydroxythreonine-4-phosphate dehydrogenase
VRTKPIIGISTGDPAGIGPEIAAKILADRSVYDICNPVIIGDAQVLKQAVLLSGLDLKLNTIRKTSDAIFQYGRPDIFDLDNIDPSQVIPGRVSALAGKAAFEAVKQMITLALADKLDATVTGPIHKESINKAGFQFSGHTEIYAHYTKTEKYAMLLVHKNMRVIHVSTHVSLKEACGMVNKARILEVIDLLHDACRKFGISAPKIGVAGLNPHAGDGGLFGNEERDEIIPAIDEAREKGYSVEGPVPADTLFTKAKSGWYDGCVAMYHDQGHIPFKMEGFQWDYKTGVMKSVKGVNITLGLPIIRTSVDHGTAFEIAGKGIASPDALKLAVEYAVMMVQHRTNESKAQRHKGTKAQS